MTTVDEAVGEFDPQQVTDALQGLIDQLESILAGAADLLAEIGATLNGVADQVPSVSFAPIVDEVEKAIDEVAELLRGIDPASLSPPLQVALQAALTLLPQDLDPVIDAALRLRRRRRLERRPRARPRARRAAEAARRGQAVRAGDAGRRPALAAVRGARRRTRRVQAGPDFLDPVKQELSALEQRLAEALDPSQVLAPVEGPFQGLLAAFDSLRPDALIEPVEGAINEAAAGVLDALPMGTRSQRSRR